MVKGLALRPLKRFKQKSNSTLKSSSACDKGKFIKLSLAQFVTQIHGSEQCTASELISYNTMSVSERGGCE